MRGVAFVALLFTSCGRRSDGVEIDPCSIGSGSDMSPGCSLALDVSGPLGGDFPSTDDGISPLHE